LRFFAGVIVAYVGRSGADAVYRTHLTCGVRTFWCGDELPWPARVPQPAADAAAMHRYASSSQLPGSWLQPPA
jgi:hypothetical protein